MGGIQASTDAGPRPPAPGFPSDTGWPVVDEFRRTYLGDCRAGVRVTLDANRECRNECEAKVLDNMEGVGRRVVVLRDKPCHKQ